MCWPAVVTASLAATKAYACQRAVQGRQILLADGRHGRAERSEGNKASWRTFHLLDGGIGSRCVCVCFFSCVRVCVCVCVFWEILGRWHGADLSRE